VRRYPPYLKAQLCEALSVLYCAATLLNKRYALTAMHCVQENGVIASNAVVSPTNSDSRLPQQEYFMYEYGPC
jgi:secreted trypsin-like serine protease